ncbi:MAG: hypothetical protein HGA31_05505 [Candidatus Moranbacteria bacterium]|nr:hypothetical protein [Candidatus Moranbacteria bacterium]
MKSKRLYLAGEPGIFGLILNRLAVPYTAYSDIHGSYTDVEDRVIGEETGWAGHLAETAAEQRMAVLREIRKPHLQSRGSYAGISHVTSHRHKMTYEGPGPELLRKVRGESCIVTSAFSIAPVPGAALPRPDYDLTISVRLESDLIEEDAIEFMRKGWGRKKREYPSDPLGFLYPFFCRSFLLSPNGTSGTMMSLEDIVGWKRDELKGLLEIAGYR